MPLIPFREVRVTSAKTAAAMREPERAQLAQDVDAFLRQGGRIVEVPRGATAFQECTLAQRRLAYGLAGAEAPKTHRRRRRRDA